jgi:hypothetical protein
MILAWLNQKKEQNSNSEALQAKKDFENVCDSKDDSRKMRSKRITTALRCRAVIDTTFVEGAEVYKKFSVSKLEAIWEQRAVPDTPKAPQFQTIKSINGEIIGYIPQEYASQVYEIAGNYQTEEISIETAIRQTQFIADEISKILRLEESFKTLNFLRDELKISSSLKERPPTK